VKRFDPQTEIDGIPELDGLSAALVATCGEQAARQFLEFFASDIDRRSNMPDIIDPFVVAKNPKGLGYRLIDAAGTNFNRMFNLLEIKTGHFARLQGHEDDLSYFAFSLSELGEKAPPGAQSAQVVSS
jgi:hypothetical protein